MNPAEFVKQFAEAMVLRGDLDEDEHDRFMVQEEPVLTSLAEGLGFRGRRYFIKAANAVVLPRDAHDSAMVGTMSRFNLAGNFVAYTAVNSPTDLGRTAINSLCLTFENVVSKPNVAHGKDELFHVPAFAVQALKRVI